jgi:hypothetical protein
MEHNRGKKEENKDNDGSFGCSHMHGKTREEWRRVLEISA